MLVTRAYLQAVEEILERTGVRKAEVAIKAARETRDECSRKEKELDSYPSTPVVVTARREATPAEPSPPPPARVWLTEEHAKTSFEDDGNVILRRVPKREGAKAPRRIYTKEELDADPGPADRLETEARAKAGYL